MKGAYSLHLQIAAAESIQVEYFYKWQKDSRPGSG